MQLRERYACDGDEDFEDAELVALVLGVGRRGASAWAVAMELLASVGGLEGLRRCEVAELARIDGIGFAQASRLHAAFALGRRGARASSPAHGAVITRPEQAAALFLPGLGPLAHEELHGLYLDRRHRVLARRRLTSGSGGYTVVDPSQVLRLAVGLDAASVLLAHNHPSGDPTPSAQDREVTNRVATAARAVGVRLVDHLIVGGTTWVSLAERGELPAWATPAASWVAGAS